MLVRFVHTQMLKSRSKLWAFSTFPALDHHMWTVTGLRCSTSPSHAGVCVGGSEILKIFWFDLFSKSSFKDFYVVTLTSDWVRGPLSACLKITDPCRWGPWGKGKSKLRQCWYLCCYFHLFSVRMPPSIKVSISDWRFNGLTRFNHSL